MCVFEWTWSTITWTETDLKLNKFSRLEENLWIGCIGIMTRTRCERWMRTEDMEISLTTLAKRVWIRIWKKSCGNWLIRKEKVCKRKWAFLKSNDWRRASKHQNLENSPSACVSCPPLHGISMCGNCVNWKKTWKTAHQRVPLGRGSWPHFMAFRCVEIVWVGRKCKARAWFWFFRRLKLVFDWMNSSSLLQLLTPPHCDVVSWWKEELKRWLRMKWQVMACIPREERHLNNFPLAAHIVCSCVCPNWRSGKTPVVASWYWNEMSVQIEYHLLVLRWQRNLHFSKHFKPTSSICWWLRVLASNWMACPKMGNV